MKTVPLSSTNAKPKRGFAAMDPERQREISAMGGRAVRPEQRTFSKDRYAASAAGRKGGMATPSEKRSFAANPTLASDAGRKGGIASREKRDA